ncbi:MAG: TerB family tellurite resistance protein [Pseudomonadota bacterium]|nr:TerB family tellurite resistance protein [Pseudomonadota bacterium]
MLAHIKNWLTIEQEKQSALVSDEHELAYLVTALMLEAAQIDGEASKDELALIISSVASQFELDDTQMTALLAEAETHADERIELHGLIRRLREQSDYEERIGVLELVWMTVLADDRVDTLESQLMRRLAGLLFVSDVDSGLAAKAAKKRLDASPAT